MSGQINLDPANRPPAAAEQPVNAPAEQRREAAPAQDWLLVEDSISPLESIWNCVFGCFKSLFTCLWDCLKAGYEALFTSSQVNEPQNNQPMTLERRVGPNVLHQFEEWSSDEFFSKFQFPCKVFIAVKVYSSCSAEQPEILQHGSIRYLERNLEGYRADLRTTLQGLNDAIAANQADLGAARIISAHKIDMALVASHKISGQEKWNVVTSYRAFSSKGNSGGTSETRGATAPYAAGLVVMTPALAPVGRNFLTSDDLFDQPPFDEAAQPQPPV